MKTLVLLTLAFAASSPSAWAGKETGNGGNAVVCTQPGVPPRLLDFYEATDLQGLHLDLGNGKTVDERLDYVLNRLDDKDGNLAKRIRSEIVIFKQRVNYLSSTIFKSIHDSNNNFIPEGCELKQLAIRDEHFSTGKIYFVNKDLWDRLSPDHQAGLILHEVLYRINGTDDSSSVRVLNGVISSAEFAEESISKYMEVLNVFSKDSSYDPDYPLQMKISGYRVAVSPSSNPEADLSVTFIGGEGSRNTVLIQGKYYEIRPQTSMTLDKDNHVVGVMLSQGQEAPYAVIDDTAVGISLSSPIGLFPSGQLRSFKVDVVIPVRLYDGTVQMNEFIFDQQGRLVGGLPLYISASKLGALTWTMDGKDVRLFFGRYCAGTPQGSEVTTLFANIYLLFTPGERKIDVKMYDSRSQEILRKMIRGEYVRCAL